jgi:hypothetical protein
LAQRVKEVGAEKKNAKHQQAFVHPAGHAIP